MFKAGISYEEFDNLTMREMRIIGNAYSEKLKEEFKTADVMAYVQGRYMVDALLCTVGNMLGGKGNYKYPEQAYSLTKRDEDLTEEEIEAQRDIFFANLHVMQHNFELSKQERT